MMSSALAHASTPRRWDTAATAGEGSLPRRAEADALYFRAARTMQAAERDRAAIA